MENQIQEQIKRPTVAAVLCFVSAAAVGARALLNAIVSVLYTFVYALNIFDLFEFGVGGGTIDIGHRMVGLNGVVTLAGCIGTLLLSLLSLVGAAALVILGVSLMKGKCSWALTVTPIVWIATSLLSVLVLIALPIVNVVGQYLIGINFVAGLLSIDLAGFLPHICSAIAWAVLLVAVVLFAGKKRKERSASVAWIVAIAVAAVFAVSAVSVPVAAVLGVVWSVILNLISGTLHMGAVGVAYMARQLLIYLINIGGALLGGGIVGACLTLTALFVTRWLVSPFKKDRA